MPVERLISGGQTGADQGGLAAAVTLGMATGGWAPHDWQTEDGPSPWLAEYGLVEHSGGYRARTRSNVADSDATVIFGDATSPGSRLTLSTCMDMDKPYFCVKWPGNDKSVEVAKWLLDYDVRVLNAAGNRESKNPGIFEASKLFFISAMWML